MRNSAIFIFTLIALQYSIIAYGGDATPMGCEQIWAGREESITTANPNSDVLSEQMLQEINAALLSGDLFRVQQVGSFISSKFFVGVRTSGSAFDPGEIDQITRLTQLGSECEVLRQRVASSYSTIMDADVAAPAKPAWYKSIFGTPAKPQSNLQERLASDYRDIDTYSIHAKEVTDELLGTINQFRRANFHNQKAIDALEKTISSLNQLLFQRPEISERPELNRVYQAALESLQLTLEHSLAVQVSNRTHLETTYQLLKTTHRMAVYFVVDARNFLERVGSILVATGSSERALQRAAAAQSLHDLQLMGRMNHQFQSGQFDADTEKKRLP